MRILKELVTLKDPLPLLYQIQLFINPTNGHVTTCIQRLEPMQLEKQIVH